MLITVDLVFGDGCTGQNLRWPEEVDLPFVCRSLENGSGEHHDRNGVAIGRAAINQTINQRFNVLGPTDKSPFQ